MEDLIKKIGHRIGEVSDRAVRALYSKISTNLISVDEIVDVEEGVIAGLILNWINERQTQADIQSLTSALKLCLEISRNEKGFVLFTDLQAPEFFNSYYKYVPSAMQLIVSNILNALVSPSFVPSKRSDAEVLPTPLDHVPQPKIIFPPHEENIQNPCEFPPVMLCDSDEKVLFDLAVTLKFGNPSEMIEACAEMHSRVLKDYPCEALLQHADLLRSIVTLAKVSSQKGVESVSVAALGVLASLLKKMKHFLGFIKSPESRPAACLPKKMVVKNEYLEISVPCLKLEQWEIGTPGPTFSLLAAVEYILNEVPLDNLKTLAAALEVWNEAQWAFSELFRFPKIISKMFDSLCNAIFMHTEKNDSAQTLETGIYIRKIIDVAQQILVKIPITEIKDCLHKDSMLSKYLADFLVFQGELCDEILPYLEQVDENLVKEYRYALKCAQALDAYRTMRQILFHEEVLPIQNMSVFVKAVEFFEKIIPVLEFEGGRHILSAIIDLNCYSLFVDLNSTANSQRTECKDLLLALLSSKIPSVVENTLQLILEGLDSSVVLSGIAEGQSRRSLLKKVLTESQILAVIIIKLERADILIKLMETPEDYELLLPYFTILQSFPETSLENILHMLTVTTSAIQPLRFIRDLFSTNPNKRAISVMILKNSNTPENIQQEWKNLRDNVWDKEVFNDPVMSLAQTPELDLQSSVKGGLSQEEISNLLNIYKAGNLEINLKVSAAEQILLHLSSGIQYESVVEEIINISLLSLLPDSEDRYVKRLVSKSLQILVLVALKYESKAKKLYTAPVKFICSLVPYVFNSYDQIRHYALYLLFILCFSSQVPRNRFIPTDLFTLIPEPNHKPFSVPILKNFASGFLMPFTVHYLSPEFYPSHEFLKFWEFVPSSSRIKNFVVAKKILKIDVDSVLDNWGKNISRSDSHAKILEILNMWVSTLKVASRIDKNVSDRLMSINSEVVVSMLGILRVPPVNTTEDFLQVSVQQIIRSVISVTAPTKPQLEFIQAVCLLVQKNAIPFISEISEVSVRRSLILSTLSLLQSLLPLHGASISPDSTLSVLSKFQQEPGHSSLISLLHKLMTITDDTCLIESILATLSIITSHSHLSVTLDLQTSPVCQQALASIFQMAVTKLMPFVQPTTFINKSAAKTCLKLFNSIPDLITLDSYMWCVRLAEDRDASLRTLAWQFLSYKSMEAYDLHNSILDIALEVVFGLKECYGVKINAARFLCKLTEEIINSEGHPCKDSIVRNMFQYAVISHIKNMIHENAGPPPSYFAIILLLLNNLMIIESKKVIAICIQIDVWDGIVRLLRPGAFQERMSNETRKPFKSVSSDNYEETLVSLISVISFVTNSIRNEPQILEHLLESTHFLSNVHSWIEDINEKFDINKEKTYSQALLAIINCLHASLYRSLKSQKHLNNFSYANIIKVLNITKSKDLKLAVSRLITSLLPIFPPDNCDEILLHLIALYKDDNTLSQQKDSTKSLSSLLFYYENAKIIAINTGFSEYLLEKGLKILQQIQNLEVQKKKQDEQSLLLKEILDILLLFKLWAANSQKAKSLLSYKDGKIGSLFRLLFSSWQLSLRREELLKFVLETICTVTSNCEDAKRSCAIQQDNRQSLLSLVIEYISRPNSASESCFSIALKILGTLCSCKESRQLLIKSKYPHGLAQRLIKEWNEIKNPELIPNKSPYIIEFLTTFAFFEEGQKVIANIGGVVDILVEVLERYSKTTVSYKAVENSFLMLRNLAFSPANKPHLLANQQALPLILSYISSPSQKPRLRKLASSALWALLYHYQKFKGILGKDQVILEIENVYKEVTRDFERNKDKEIADDLKNVSENLNCVLKICRGE